MTFVALIRGVNVGGKFMKMEILRSSCEALNFSDVQTYVQSGNVIFKASGTPTSLEKKLEEKIKKVFKYEAPVVIKKPEELKKVLKGNPFLKDKGVDTKHLYVTFLKNPPGDTRVREATEKISAFATRFERFIIRGSIVYLHCPKGYGETKLNNNIFEKKLDVIATTRNWNTVETLVSLAKNAGS